MGYKEKILVTITLLLVIPTIENAVVESFGEERTVIVDLKVYYSDHRPAKGFYTVLSNTPYRSSYSVEEVLETDSMGRVFINKTLKTYTNKIYLCLFIPPPYNIPVDLNLERVDRNCIELLLENVSEPNIYNITILLNEYGVEAGDLVVKGVYDEYNRSIDEYTVRIFYNSEVVREEYCSGETIVSGIGEPPLISYYTNRYGDRVRPLYNVEVIVSNDKVASIETTIPNTVVFQADIHNPVILGYNISCINNTLAEYLNLWIELNYTDGTNTKDVDVEASISIGNRKGTIQINRRLVREDLASINLSTRFFYSYVREFIESNETIHVIVRLIDPYNHETLLTYNISREEIITKNISINETVIGELEEYPESLLNNTITKEFRENFSSSEEYAPENKTFEVSSGETRYHSVLVDLGVPAIALATIILELKRRRGL